MNYFLPGDLINRTDYELSIDVVLCRNETINYVTVCRFYKSRISIFQHENTYVDATYSYV